MPRKLKVFRTAVGFHDAYVAAPSRKAALEAWGTDKDLFARGVAEEVTDAALAKPALARPGEVIRVSRGGAREQIAALGKAPKPKKRVQPVELSMPPDRPPAARPSRATLDKAEAALERLRDEHQTAREALAERHAHEERKLFDAQRAAEERGGSELAKARDAYDAAMEAWRETL
ncbi:MAG TPA: hypothetical protein VM055_00555 [Novosphingobium sp.]|nr:hypothetical protein [Novosphingobium sp.]